MKKAVLRNTAHCMFQNANFFPRKTGTGPGGDDSGRARGVQVAQAAGATPQPCEAAVRRSEGEGDRPRVPGLTLQSRDSNTLLPALLLPRTEPPRPRPPLPGASGKPGLQRGHRHGRVLPDQGLRCPTQATDGCSLLPNEDAGHQLH